MRKFLMLFCLAIFVSPLFATDPDISANTTTASCADSVLNTNDGPANIEVNWEPNNIALHWYTDSDATTEMNVASASQSCTYDGTLTPPATIPTKTGYTFKGWKIREVPDAYTRVQYLQSDGARYITTNISGFDTDDWEIYAEWMILTWKRYGGVFGVYSAGDVNSYIVRLYSSDNNHYLVTANTKPVNGNKNVSDKPRNVIHTATVRNQEFEFDGEHYTITAQGDTLSSGSVLRLFTWTNSTTYCPESRIYSVWAKKSGELRFKGIPVIRNSDNTPGIWDAVNRVFYTGTGSGSFTAGPALQ